MDDIENYSIFGINIGGGKRQPPSNKDETLFVSGLLGGAILGLSIAQIMNTMNDTEYRKKIQNIIRDSEEKRNINEKLQHIKHKIESYNDIDVYGGILILFSELEKFIDALYTKYIRLFNQPDTFREKVYELENGRIISGIESNILRNEIYPKRNLISHGKYNSVNKRDITACYDFISQFIKKYYSLLQQQ
jgi:hypothetical protein